VIKLLIFAAVVLLTVIGVGILFGISRNAPAYSGPISDHFDGTVFRNPEPVSHASIWKGLRYFFTTSPGPWDVWRENPPASEIRERSRELRVTFINHATTLLQIDSLNILTDPTYSLRASPLAWIGPTRKHAPGIPLEELPPIDLVILSHNHYDHTDLPTLDSLATRYDPQFIVGLGCGDLLKEIGITRIQELDWGASAQFGSISITGEQCRHFSGRGWSDRQKTLWMSYVIAGASSTVYFAGDTGYGSQFTSAGKRYGGFDLAMLPIGAYNPRWFMQTLHLNPEEAVMAHKELRARNSMGIHFGTFKLSEESQDDPIKDLATVKRERGIDEADFRTLYPGEAWDIATTQPGDNQ
jgi:L-ascorbate metabolism protein UlaG (beta-lactamase superfamily)